MRALAWRSNEPRSPLNFPPGSWVNFAVGGILAALCAISAVILVTLYGEPRLFLSGAGFSF
jgi:hypothetical protein